MDKKKLVELIRNQIQSELKILKDIAKDTAEAATHEESKPENQYDTRALESSYLAGAQAKRILEMEEVLLMYKLLNPRDFSSGEKIQATAVVEVDLNGKSSWFFIAPKGAGLSVDFDGKKINVITPSSPLGESLIGLTVGDCAVVEKPDQVLEYLIQKII